MLTGKTLYLIRHAETVFNRAARMQGNDAHTPLTANGTEQALALARYCREHLGEQPNLVFWCSPAGRTRQTAAIIAEALAMDYFSIRFDARLREIDVGDWMGETYADLVARHGQIIDPSRRFFIQRPPGGEWYGDMAERLTDWARDVAADAAATHLAISHGLASRVLRGVLMGREHHTDVDAVIAPDIPQGQFVALNNGSETIHAPGGPASFGRGL